MNIFSPVKVALSSLLLFLLLLPYRPQAQSVLDQKISISFDNLEIKSAVELISQQSEIKFSYSPSILPKTRISKSYNNQSLRGILGDLFGEGFDFLVRGNYIIIKRKPASNQPKTSFQIEGAVIDANTGLAISDASIYEVGKLTATLSNDQGGYELAVASKDEYVTFAISRENYQDTIIVLSQGESIPNEIALKPVENPTPPKKEPKKIVKLFTNEKSRQHVRNVRMEEERAFQFSFLPMLGTNGAISGRVQNKVSFNLIAGYAYGLDGFEIGGVVNVERKDVKGVQIAGFGNMVGGKANGLQISGFNNNNVERTKGVQITGFLNTVTNEMHGAQFAGFTNMNIHTFGWQVAGFANYTRSDMKGVQISGFFNFARQMDGVQIAGFANYAKTLKGVSIGIVNVAESVEKGATIGLFNWVKDGFHSFELEHDDVLNTSLAFKSGTDWFYSFASAGYNVGPGDIWGYGLGFGSQFRIQSLFTGVEISSVAIQETTQAHIDGLNLDNRFQVNLGYQFASHFAVLGGPILHVYVSDYANPDTGEIGSNIGNNSFLDSTSAGGTRTKMWIGYRVAIRI